ncbi:MAG: hypothetical protein ACI8UO_001416 [Verrucomicrobiales bacterium]|jgi:hypothetical protein
MAQSLQFTFGKNEFACSISKVDRAKIYGSVELEVLDENGRKCDLATLAGDGKTLIPAGGTALAYVSPDGDWREKSGLTPVDIDGNRIEPVTSTFKETTDLGESVSHEEFLSHNIRLIYLIDVVEGEMPQQLLEDLAGGSIYKFQFSYRGGLEADAAFLIADGDGTPWMLVGKPTKIQFIGYEQTAASVGSDEDGDEAEVAGDLMDFGL